MFISPSILIKLSQEYKGAAKQKVDTTKGNILKALFIQPTFCSTRRLGSN